MSFKTRRIIFYTLFFLFILTGLGVVFYSRGWRVDINSCHFTQLQDCRVSFNKIGAVFIETEPKGVIIKIDGKTFTDKSGLMQSGTLISNLLPKTYKVEIEKDGYQSWQKNILVKPSLVTEILQVILIPEKLEKISILISKPIGDFWLSPQKKIVLKSNGALYYSQDFSTFNKFRGDEFISWSDNESKIILRDSKNQIYYLYDLSSAFKTFNINAAFNNFQATDITKIAFHPTETNRLIVADKNGLYLLDLNRSQLESLFKKPLTVWTIKNPNIYYIYTKKINNQGLLTNSYVLGSFNLVSRAEDLTFELPGNLIHQKPIKVAALGNKIAVLFDNGGLYLFNQQNQDFKQIASSAEDFVFSPDAKKIAFWDKTCPVGSQTLSCGGGKINIYFMEDYQKGITKKAGDVISFNFYPKTDGLIIKDISWHKDSSHIFVETQTSVDFLEIDDRLPINKYTLVEKASDFYYEPNSNRLYFIQSFDKLRIDPEQSRMGQENNLYFVEL